MNEWELILFFVSENDIGAGAAELNTTLEGVARRI